MTEAERQAAIKAAIEKRGGAQTKVTNESR
jgi:hypothetical protein